MLCRIASAVVILALTATAGMAEVFCYLPTECTGLTEPDTNDVTRTQTRAAYLGAPTFPPTIPGDGNTITRCERFAQATQDESTTSPGGWEKIESIGCGRMFTSTVSRYDKHGAPTAIQAGQSSVTITTGVQIQEGVQYALPLGEFGTVTTSVQITATNQWATTMTVNVLLWTQLYRPQIQRGTREGGERCGDQATGSHMCLEH